jgi:hypothetical protein
MVFGTTDPEKQDTSADFVLLHQGSQVISIRYAARAGGSVAGVVTVLGTDLPFTGRLTGNHLTFQTVAPNGVSGRWDATIAGDRMTVTVTNPSGSERHALTRRGVGWSDQTPLAREWTAALTGRSWSQSEGNSSSSGSFTAQRTVIFCPRGVAQYSASSAINMSVPGVSGSGTGRDADRGTWRVITQGDVAALEVTTATEGTMQLGLRPAQGEMIYLAEQLVRLGVGGGCSAA